MWFCLLNRGSTDATRHAHQLITALIKDPDQELMELLPKYKTPNKALAACPSTTTVSVLSNSNVTASPGKVKSPRMQSGSGKVVSTQPPMSIGVFVVTTTMLQAQHQANMLTTTNSRAVTAHSQVACTAAAASKHPSTAARQLFPSEKKTLASTSVAAKPVVTYTTAHTTNSMPQTSAATYTTFASKVWDGKPGNGGGKSVNTAASMSKPGTPQPVPATSSVAQTTSVMSSSPAEYSPFMTSSIFSQAQQGVWGSSQPLESRMNFASVTAGVASRPSSTPGIPVSDAEFDPNLPAKAPGYRANFNASTAPPISLSEIEGARTPAYRGSMGSLGSIQNDIDKAPGSNKPQMSPSRDDLDLLNSRAPGYKPMGLGPTPADMTAPVSVFSSVVTSVGTDREVAFGEHSRAPGYKPPISRPNQADINAFRSLPSPSHTMPNFIPSMPAGLIASTVSMYPPGLQGNYQLGQVPPRPSITPPAPATPPIQSNLNPNAPDFNITQGARGFNPNNQANFRPPLFDAQMPPGLSRYPFGHVGAGMSGLGTQVCVQGMAPPGIEQPARLYSSHPEHHTGSLSTTSTSSVGTSSRDEGSPVPQSSPVASPRSSNASSPTEQHVKSFIEERKLPRPIGTERARRNQPGLAPSAMGDMGAMGAIWASIAGNTAPGTKAQCLTESDPEISVIFYKLF